MVKELYIISFYFKLIAVRNLVCPIVRRLLYILVVAFCNTHLITHAHVIANEHDRLL